MRVVHVEPAPLASVQVTQTKNEDPLGTIGLPVRDHMNTMTATALLQTDWAFLGPRTLDRIIVKGSILTLQRNECVQRMRGGWLLFIDDDMVWQADAVARLVARYDELKVEFPDTPIMVGGLCFRRVPPHQPTMYMREQPTAGLYNFLEKWSTDVVEVDATGMAFVLIEQAVFEAVMGGPMLSAEERLARPPWLHFEWTAYMGEDIGFCQKAKDAGARIFVDTTIEIGHVGEYVFGLRDFWDQITQRPIEVERARRKLNAAQGLPTLSATAANKLLGRLG